MTLHPHLPGEVRALGLGPPPTALPSSGTVGADWGDISAARSSRDGENSGCWGPPAAPRPERRDSQQAPGTGPASSHLPLASPLARKNPLASVGAEIKG